MNVFPLYLIRRVFEVKKWIFFLLTLTVLLIFASCNGNDPGGIESEQEISVAIGDIVQFGDYSWIVLDVEGHYALIITEYAHILRNRGSWNDRCGPITWRASDMRRYMNDDFYQRFSVADRMRIRETYVVNNDNPWNGTCPWYDSIGGENTTDKIFFLSVEEVVRYFGDSGQMNDRPDGIGTLPFINWISDEYDTARIGRDEEGKALSWWLRTPGAHQRLVTFVDPLGVIAMYGTSAVQFPTASRPALWLNVADLDLYPPLDTEDYSEYPVYSASELTEAPLDYPTDSEEYLEIIIQLPQPHTPPGAIAMEYILFMNDYLYGRSAFTYRELEAAQWLVETLLEIGFDETDILMQEFSKEDAANAGQFAEYDVIVELAIWHADPGGQELRNYSQNVILTLPGRSERTIIVGAHYDTWPFPGAVDNASGVALLLESAQRMRDLDHYHTLIYIFFGAEEIGCLGALYYIWSLDGEERDNILFMLNADLLFEGPYLLYTPGVVEPGTSFWGPPGENHITRAWDNIARELGELHYDLELISYPEGVNRFISDHFPFYRIGIPSIMFSGMYRTEDGAFTRRPFMFLWDTCEEGHPTTRWVEDDEEGAFPLPQGILHSERDCFHFIHEHWPDKIERAMWGYGLFLEAILLQQYY